MDQPFRIALADLKVCMEYLRQHRTLDCLPREEQTACRELASLCADLAEEQAAHA